MLETEHYKDGVFHYVVHQYIGEAREILASANYTTPVYLN